MPAFPPPANKTTLTETPVNQPTQPGNDEADLRHSNHLLNHAPLRGYPRPRALGVLQGRDVPGG